MITLYSTGCPRCKVVKSKLDATGFQYNVVDDVEQMMELGINTVPVLVADDNVMEFTEAVKFLNDVLAFQEENPQYACDSCSVQEVES